MRIGRGITMMIFPEAIKLGYGRNESYKKSIYYKELKL